MLEAAARNELRVDALRVAVVLDREGPRIGGLRCRPPRSEVPGFGAYMLSSAAFWLSFASTSSLRFRAAATLPSRLLLMKTTYSSFEILWSPSVSISLSIVVHNAVMSPSGPPYPQYLATRLASPPR